MGHPLPSIPPATKDQASLEKNSSVLGFNKLGVSQSPWPTQRWLILTAHGNGYCHQWQQRQNRQDGQALNSTHRKRTTGETIRGGFESWGLVPPNPVHFPYFKKINPIQTKQDETSCFFVGKSLSLGPTSQLHPWKSTWNPKIWRLGSDHVPFQLAHL